MDIICINDSFSQEWESYFSKYNIVKPVKDSIYTIREVVNFLYGEKGLLLNEIVNNPTPRISPTTKLEGMSEQAWAISRFRTLSGDNINLEEVRKVLRQEKV